MSNQILSALLDAWESGGLGPKETLFRTAHPDSQQQIDDLVFTGRIRRRNGCLVIDPVGLADLATVDQKAHVFHKLCAQVFHEARQFAIKNPEIPMPVRALLGSVGLDLQRLVGILTILLETSIWSTHSNDLSHENASLTPSTTGILRHKEYDALIAEARAVADRSSAAILSLNASREHLQTFPRHETTYVDAGRLAELKAIRNASFDLSRLIRLCEELNLAHSNESWMACAMLTRAIVDHVPPIFGCASFSIVANNVAGTSIKNNLNNLHNSLRNVANSHLHLQARQKEVLPTAAQVNFRADVDVLLGEIVRQLK